MAMRDKATEERLERRVQALFAEARARSDGSGLLTAPFEGCAALLFDKRLELLVIWGTFDQKCPLIAALSLVQDPPTGDCGLLRSRITPFARQDALYALLPAAASCSNANVQEVVTAVLARNGGAIPVVERPPSFLVHMNAALEEDAVREGFRAMLRSWAPELLARFCVEVERSPLDPWGRPSHDDAVPPAGTTAEPRPWSGGVFDRWWQIVTGDADHFCEEISGTLDAWHGAITKAQGRLPVVVGVHDATVFVRRFLAPCHAQAVAQQAAAEAVVPN